MKSYESRGLLNEGVQCQEPPSSGDESDVLLFVFWLI